MRLHNCVLPALVLGGIGIVVSPSFLWSQATPPAAVVALPNAPEGQMQSAAQPGHNLFPDRENGASGPHSSSDGDVSGTVTDAYGDVVPGASVSIEGGSTHAARSQEANDNGFFEFKNLPPGDSYRLTVSAEGFQPWTSDPVTLAPGQFFDVTGIKLMLKGESASVTVVGDPVQIATEQVHIAEQQRVMGFIPNFYVVYDSKNAVPLTTKLKFQLAYKVAVDPVSIFGAGTLAAIDQAGNRLDYQQGWNGYGQRFGANYADNVTDIMFGGAILPALLHQDPRYFYQGTGTVKSRLVHALSNPFICRGDNGKNQINFSSMGGDLISSALSNTYYPDSNRGPSLVFGGFAISTGVREVSSVMQEFVIRKLTPSARRQNSSLAY